MFPVHLAYAMNAVTYTDFRERLARVMDQVVENREVIVVTRRGHPDVALLAADELSSLLETVYLVRSPANAQRLLGALQNSYTGEGTQKLTFDELVQAAQEPGPTVRKPRS